ncbi:MAG: hypothetical protein R3F43_00860 [bacterium]
MHVQVAAAAVLGDALVVVLDVALGAVDAPVLALQGVAALGVVVEDLLRPGRRRVALLALLLELGRVEVLVAVAAGRIDGPVVAVLVAAVAGHVQVLPLELEARNRMIEQGNAEALEALVAVVAGPLLELAAVQILVAPVAVLGGVHLGLGALGVAAVAGLILVLPGQGEARDAMVEAGLLPVGRRVAVGAGAAREGVAVGVLLAVAALAGVIDGLVLAPGVAAGAVHPPVPATQRELAHGVVVEDQVLEPGLLVAAPAGRARELAAVGVVVAAGAVLGARLPLLPGVAVEALHLLVLALQRPARRGVVEGAGVLEPLGDVALVADALPEDARRVRVGVAGAAALHGDGPEGALALVALRAVHLQVLARAGKPGLALVIEAQVGVELLPPVGVVAAIALAQIRLAGLAVVLAVAVRAARRRPQVAVAPGLRPLGRVARPAPHLLVVARQGPARLLVIEGVAIQARDVVPAAQVLAVAVVALHRRRLAAVEALVGLHPAVDVEVAGAALLFGHAAERHMAPVALVLLVQAGVDLRQRLRRVRGAGEADQAHGEGQQQVADGVPHVAAV